MPSTLTDTPAPQWGEPAGWQLPLAQLCDSALPTGAFSHSFGLETYICEGVVDGEASFVSWLRALVSTQLTFSEGLGLRLAFEAVAADDWEAIAHLDALLVAQAVPIQVRRAGVTMGRRMLTIARLALEGTDGGRLLSRYAALVDTGGSGNTGNAGDTGGCRSHPAIVLAIAGYALEAPPAAVTAAYLQSSVISLTQNAVRAIPGRTPVSAPSPRCVATSAPRSGGSGASTRWIWGPPHPGSRSARCGTSASGPACSCPERPS